MPTGDCRPIHSESDRLTFHHWPWNQIDRSTQSSFSPQEDCFRTLLCPWSKMEIAKSPKLGPRPELGLSPTQPTWFWNRNQDYWTSQYWHHHLYFPQLLGHLCPCHQSIFISSTQIFEMPLSPWPLLWPVQLEGPPHVKSQHSYPHGCRRQDRHHASHRTSEDWGCGCWP